ncbi:hypothetical protein SAMN05444714_0772 [Yoonia litorea]|uniref:Uncharacterized protein n=1 Tax=Yoonia litorea TaxID=1123755 RepID=A0A1I6LPP0_9RHOB|nr:hypothetical protein SAMN05444714_0772 [Yoonia litorea]
MRGRAYQAATLAQKGQSAPFKHNQPIAGQKR